MKKRFMIALCCLVLLVNLLPIVPMAETTVAGAADKGTVSQDLYYCRAELAKLPNGKALVDAYDRIVEGINNTAAEIEINLSVEEFKLVLDATRRDHTEQFWLDSGYGIISPKGDETVVSAIQPKYTMTGAELTDARLAFEQAVQNFLGRLTPDMSEYEIEKAIHDMIATQVVYTTGATNAHNAYGALVEGKAVCEGYAESLQYLLQRVGIQSVEVFGYGITNPETKEEENHAWNIVRIDGEYYLVDLTWDDQGKNNYLSYAYFNQTSAIFNADHIAWVVGYENGENWDGGLNLPECTATVANYYTKNDLRINNYTMESIGELLKNNKHSVTVFVDADPAAFLQWYNENIQEIARAAGVTGSFLYGHTQNRREVHLTIETCGHTQMKLVEAKSATCTEEGNTAYYVCQNKDCGKWFTDAEAKSEILNKDLVKVLPQGHTWERKEDEAALKEGDTYWYTCSTCGTISDTLSFGLEPEEPAAAFDFNAIIDFLLANPIILGGGGGVIVLAIIIAIISKVRG